MTEVVPGRHLVVDPEMSRGFLYDESVGGP